MWCRLASNFYECVKSSSMYLDGPNSNWFSLSQSWTELEHWLNFATFKGPVRTHCGPPSSPTTHNQVGIWLRPLGNAANVACLTLLWQGSKWLSGISIWLVFRRSWGWIPALDPGGLAMWMLQFYGNTVKGIIGTHTKQAPHTLVTTTTLSIYKHPYKSRHPWKGTMCIHYRRKQKWIADLLIWLFKRSE